MSIFLNNDARLRPGWKFVVYVVFLVLIGLGAGIALSMFSPPRDSTPVRNDLFFLALNEIALFIPAVGAMWLCVRFADHRPFSAFGIGFLPGWRRDFLLGLAAAAGMLAIVIGGCYAFGYVSMRWTGGQASPGTLLATFGLLLLAALNEELVFRGFPLQTLVEAVGEWPAIVGLSLLFGAMHLNNPSVSVLGLVNTVVAGILLSLAYLRTRSLWMPYAIHVGWNVGLGFVFGFQLSGIDIASLFTTGTAGSEAILGGGYGPEGGLLATFVFAAAAVIVERHGSINRRKAHSGRLVGGRDRIGTPDS